LAARRDGRRHPTGDRGLRPVGRRSGPYRTHLGGDPRVRFNIAEGGDWLRRWSGGPFDLVFADAWSGKFSDLDAALRLLAIGGLYVIDDLLPQPSWPDGHGPRIEPLLAELEGRPDLACVRLAWSSGLAVAVKRA
jgi:predicted O-methyltransferase YrrM